MEIRWAQNLLAGVLFAWVAGMTLASDAHAADLERLLMPGEVIAGHAEIESECTACHAAFARERQNSLCIDCHQEAGADQLDGLGFHGRNPQASKADCADCHTEHKGRSADIVAFDAQNFSHLFTDFKLVSGHAEAECEDCHKPEELYRDAPGECVDCHRGDDVHKGGLGEDCASCHVAERWETVEFQHETETSFALLFGHAGLSCDSCHVEQSFNDTDSACVSCHLDDDVHDGLLGTDCSSCHDEVRWTQTRFRHNTFSDFSLLGGHVDLSCEACHFEPTVVSNPGSECIDCHRDDDLHEGQLGEACVSCHNENSWLENIRFDHVFTAFPLLGEHRVAECTDCHESARFSDAPVACSDCHSDADIHNGVLGNDCGTCHTPADWSRWRFDHLLVTDFELDGAHQSLQCADCHKETPAQNQRTASRCIDCHRSDDVHAGQFGKACERCHTTQSFRGAEELWVH